VFIFSLTIGITKISDIIMKTANVHSETCVQLLYSLKTCVFHDRYALRTVLFLPLLAALVFCLHLLPLRALKILLAFTCTRCRAVLDNVGLRLPSAGGIRLPALLRRALLCCLLLRCTFLVGSGWFWLVCRRHWSGGVLYYWFFFFAATRTTPREH
jgi:hypothetical protein